MWDMFVSTCFTEPAKVNSPKPQVQVVFTFGLDTRSFHTANHEMALQDQACKKTTTHLMLVTEEGNKISERLNSALLWRQENK